MTAYEAATHARCNAHVLPELRAVCDHHQRSGVHGDINDTGHLTGQDAWCWAAQASGTLRTMKRLVATPVPATAP